MKEGEGRKKEREKRKRRDEDYKIIAMLVHIHEGDGVYNGGIGRREREEGELEKRYDEVGKKATKGKENREIKG